MGGEWEEAGGCSMGLGHASPLLAAALGRVTSLQVTEVRRDSVTLTWSPVPGASGYILSWSPPTGKTGGCPWAGQCACGSHCPPDPVPGWQRAGSRGAHCPALPAPSRSRGCAWASATPSPCARCWAARPALRHPSASAQVPWGHRGDLVTGICSSSCFTASLSAVCRDARGDIVFLVHGTRDSSSGADAIRTLLSNTVSALGHLGPDGTQVGAVVVGDPRGHGRVVVPTAPCALAGGPGHIQLPQPALAAAEPLQ